MSKNNSLPNTTVDYLSQPEDKLLLALEVSAVPVIVFGNLLIISAVLRFKSLRYASNVMVVSLAFADLMMGGIYLPLKILLAEQPHLFVSRAPCLANIFLSFFCVTNAMSFLSMISVERFYAVQFPFHYHSYMTMTISIVWSCFTLVIPIALAIPAIVGIDHWKPGLRCFSTYVMPRYYVWGGVATIFMVSFVGFLSFLRVMFAEISIRWRSRAQNISESRKQESVKATLMLTVYVFSILCWIPQLVVTCISAFKPGYVSATVLRTVSFLGICSSGINCFIYGIKNSKFKAAFRNMFGCKTASIDVNLTTELNTAYTDA